MTNFDFWRLLLASSTFKIHSGLPLAGASWAPTRGWNAEWIYIKDLFFIFCTHSTTFVVRLFLLYLLPFSFSDLCFISVTFENSVVLLAPALRVPPVVTRMTVYRRLYIAQYRLLPFPRLAV